VNPAAAIPPQHEPIAPTDANWQVFQEERPRRRAAAVRHDWSFNNFETFDVANHLVREASSVLPAPPPGVERERLLGGFVSGTAQALTAEAPLKSALDEVLASWGAGSEEYSPLGDLYELDR
jgi:hypothetical protein